MKNFEKNYQEENNSSKLDKALEIILADLVDARKEAEENREKGIVSSLGSDFKVMAMAAFKSASQNQ